MMYVLRRWGVERVSMAGVLFIILAVALCPLHVQPSEHANHGPTHGPSHGPGHGPSSDVCSPALGTWTPMALLALPFLCGRTVLDRAPSDYAVALPLTDPPPRLL